MIKGCCQDRSRGTLPLSDFDGVVCEIKAPGGKESTASALARLHGGDKLQSHTTCRDESDGNAQEALLLWLLYCCFCVVVTLRIMVIQGGDLIRRRGLS